MFFHEDITVESTSCYSQNRPNLLLLRLLTDPVPKQKSWKTIARIDWLIRDRQCFVENEKVLVYFNKNIDAGQVSCGSIIVTSKKLQPIRNIKGVAFDYIGYCHNRHIEAQLFLQDNNFAVIETKNQQTFSVILGSFRKKLLIILKKQIPRKSENGFLEALLFGYTDDLDPDLMKSYTDTGVIHIIAISGLHLALICQILQTGFKRLGRSPVAIWVSFGPIVSILWVYGLFTGASPSVIRAAAMFSLVLFARNILREAGLINTLAATAFLLLCFDPFWLWDTGFQLSYAAILGLGIFSGPFQNALLLKNKILQSVWKAVSVTLAAQVFTTPLCIYYFHQFPMYFLLANLLAVPLSSGILVGGILLCIFYPVKVLAGILGWSLAISVQVLNGFIMYFSKLPGAVISGLVLNLPQLISIYFVIFCLHRFLSRKQRSWLMAGLCGVSLFQVFRFF